MQIDGILNLYSSQKIKQQNKTKTYNWLRTSSFSVISDLLTISLVHSDTLFLSYTFQDSLSVTCRQWHLNLLATSLLSIFYLLQVEVGTFEPDVLTLSWNISRHPSVVQEIKSLERFRCTIVLKKCEVCYHYV